MLKLTSVALGLLATAAIAQPSLAAKVANTSTSSIARPADNLHSQLIIKIGDRGYHRNRYDWQRARQERLARQRWEARQYRRWLRNRDYYRSRYDYRYDQRW